MVNAKGIRNLGIITDRFHGGLSYRKVAKKWGVSVGCVQKIIQRCHRVSEDRKLKADRDRAIVQGGRGREIAAGTWAVSMGLTIRPCGGLFETCRLNYSVSTPPGVGAVLQK